MSDHGVEAELKLHLATPVQTASRNTAYSSSTKSRRDGKDGHLHCMDAHGLRVSAAFGLRRVHGGCVVMGPPPFCGATFITGGGAGGDPLSASLRALVGAGSADPSKSRKSPVKTPPRRRGAPGGITVYPRVQASRSYVDGDEPYGMLGPCYCCCCCVPDSSSSSSTGPC